MRKYRCGKSSFSSPFVCSNSRRRAEPGTAPPKAGAMSQFGVMNAMTPERGIHHLFFGRGARYQSPIQSRALISNQVALAFTE